MIHLTPQELQAMGERIANYTYEPPVEDDVEGYELVTATAMLRDEGTIVVFSGLTEDNVEVTFAVEHRYAYAIAEAIAYGEEPQCAVPDYLIMMRA